MIDELEPEPRDQVLHLRVAVPDPLAAELTGQLGRLRKGVGANAPSQPLRVCLEYLDLPPPLDQVPGGRQAGQPGANDEAAPIPRGRADSGRHRSNLPAGIAPVAAVPGQRLGCVSSSIDGAAHEVGDQLELAVGVVGQELVH